MDPQLQLEMLRRRATMPASSAGIGAENTNSLSPSNPIATEGGMDIMTNPPLPKTGGAGGTQSDRSAAALGKQKGESEVIINALIQRLKTLSAPTNSQPTI